MPLEPRLLLILAGAVLAAVASGCLQPSGIAAECGRSLLPSDVPSSAPSRGGPGPEGVRVKVLDASNASLASVPVVAWWQTSPDRVAFVALRTDGEGSAWLDLPEDVTAFVMSGDGAWTHDARIAPDGSVTGSVRGNGTGVVELLPALADGFAAGLWTQLVPTGLPVGVAPVGWAPAKMPWADASHIARLEGLDLRLAWRNNMDGYVDLAIGVGRPDDWRAYNQDVQTGAGTFVETLHLTRADLEPWKDGDLYAGPASGTYGVVVDQLAGVTYDLRWTATFTIDAGLGDLCVGFGDVRLSDVTS